MRLGGARHHIEEALNDSEAKSRIPLELRRKAEERLSGIEAAAEDTVANVDAVALLHELQVHQTELEMQNEELLHARSEAEDALFRYTDLYDFAPIGYFTVDASGSILEVNLAGAELLGAPRAELVGADFRLFVVRESILVFRDFLQAVFDSDETKTCELRVLRSREPGAQVRVDGTATKDVEGPKQCRMAVIDITDRKRAEEMLQAAYDDLEIRVDERTAELVQARAESEQRAAELQSVLANMADGVILSDAEGRVTYVNDACIEILEAPPDETFEDWLSRFERFTLDGELLPCGESATARALAGETVRSMSIRGVTPWGKWLTISISASPIRDAEGRILGATTVFHDISERVEFERRQHELLERERHISEVLQQSLVPPQRQYQLPGCRISVTYQAALKEAQVGGDFYDVFELGEGKIGILIGDVAGKGLAAAIQVAAARHSIRSYAFLDLSPARVMTLANEALCKGQEDAESMMTAFFAVLDTRDSRLEACTAGHEPPFVRTGSGEVFDLDCAGRALAIIPGFDYALLFTRCNVVTLL